MTTKFRVHFTDGKQATMLDMEERGLAHAKESVAARFGAHRIDKVEEMKGKESHQSGLHPDPIV